MSDAPPPEIRAALDDCRAALDAAVRAGFVSPRISLPDGAWLICGTYDRAAKMRLLVADGTRVQIDFRHPDDRVSIAYLHVPTPTVINCTIGFTDPAVTRG